MTGWAAPRPEARHRAGPPGAGAGAAGDGQDLLQKRTLQPGTVQGLVPAKDDQPAAAAHIFGQHVLLAERDRGEVGAAQIDDVVIEQLPGSFGEAHVNLERPLRMGTIFSFIS